jgi:hypothetical protein
MNSETKNLKVDNQIEKTYNYIVGILQTQKKPLPFSVLYGDGSVHNHDKKIFRTTYKEVLNMLRWKAKDDLI